MLACNNKVGIVTMVGSDNYGNALQNYAVQTLIEQAGFEAYTLLDRTKRGFFESAQEKLPLWRRLSPSYVKRYLRVREFRRTGCKNDRDFTRQGHGHAVSHHSAFLRAKQEFHEKFEAFRGTMLHWDEAFLDCARNDRQHFSEYYAFVCGSDQVWGPHFHTTSSVSFLQFAPSFKRIALAPSFGTSKIPESRREIYAEWLKGIPHLSVREDAGAEIIQELAGRKAQVLLDPTFVLSAEQWREFSRRPSSAPQGKYVFCYFLGNMGREYREWIERYAAERDCAIVDILDIQDLEHYALGPQEFVWLLDHAEAVFTDSFHGTAFSINLQRPLVVFERMEGGTSMSSRISTILKRTGLEARKFPLATAEEVDKCDFSQAAQVIETGRRELVEYLARSLDDVGRHDGINLVETLQCTGCGACVNACATGALSMIADGEGFSYPVVDGAKCVKCGRCQQACPVNLPMAEQHDGGSDFPRAYWAYAKDSDVCGASSSGGVFSLLAGKVLSQGGVVFGVGYDDKWNVVHRRIQDVSEIPLLRTSKYVQSDTGLVYREAETDLKAGRQVLFSGTPCQIAALKRYLGREYHNLWTQDIICHGVPSPGVWGRYLQQEHLNNGKKPTAISFRDKTRGWNDFSMKVDYDDGRSYCCLAVRDPFEKAFLANLTLRPSCHRCQFKTLRHSSDITLADYWGVELVHPQLKEQQGVSLVLVHSARGEKLFEELRDDMMCGKTDRERGIGMSRGALRSAAPHPRRQLFFSRWQRMPLDENIEECLRLPLAARIKKQIKRVGAKGKKWLRRLFFISM